MPVYTVVSPYLVNLNANDLTSAVKQFAKTYYHMKINEIIVKDQIKNYRATLKYFKDNGTPRVGIRMFPHLYPVVASTTPITQVMMAPQPGNVVRKDGTIQEYNHSPSMMVTHTFKHDTTKDDENDSDKTLVMSPFSPIAPVYPGLMGMFPGWVGRK